MVVAKSESAGPSYFVRNATGLVRELSALDSFFLNILSANPIGNVAVLVTLGIAIFPGTNMWASMLSAVAVGSSMLVLYSMLAAAMPRSGGDYVFVSRLIHPAVGFVVSWLMMFTCAFWAGYNGWAWGSWVLPGIFGALGKWMNSPGLLHLAAVLPQTGWVLLLGVLTIVLYFGMGLMGLRWAVRFQIFAFIFIVLSVVFAVPALLGVSPGSFVHNFNSFAANYHTSARQVLAIAAKNGYTGPGKPSLGATIAFWPMAMALTGYAIMSISVAGEVRSPLRSQLWGTIAANVIGGGVMALFFYLIVSRVGANMIGALGFFNFVDPGKSPFPFPLYGHVLPGIIVGSPALAILLGIATFTGMFVGAYNLQIWATRYIFAWSFDRLLPSWAADVNERTHAPVNALLIVAVISLGFMFLLVLDPTLTFVATGLLQEVLFVVVSIAGIILPWRMPELYKGSIKKEIGGVPVITIMGVISLVFNLLMAYYFLTNGAYGATSTTSWQFAGALIVSGLVYYIVSKLVNRAKGVNLDLAFREIPPE